MATRPLDAAFGGSTTKKSKKRGAILAVGIVAGLASIGSIFAATISVNGDTEISFTQGTTTIAACDPDGITAAVSAYYDNAVEGFNLDTITLTGVDAACDAKVLTLSLWDAENELVTITGTIDSTTVEIGVAGAGLITDTVNDGTAANVLVASPAVNYVSPNDAETLASNARRIVIEIN